MHKQKHPKLMNWELKAWVAEKFKHVVHEAMIYRALQKRLSLLSNMTANFTKRNQM